MDVMTKTTIMVTLNGMTNNIKGAYAPFLFRVKKTFYNRKEEHKMTQQELYDLAGTLNDNEAAYLMASYLEQREAHEFGFNIDLNDNWKIKGIIEYVPKN